MKIWRMHVNYIKAQRRKYRKQRDKFIAQHEFKTASELPLTVEELTDVVELNRIICLEFNGRKQFPTFQFNEDGLVYPVLQEHLPQLLNSDWNSWEVCFWIYRENAVVIKELQPDARMLRNVTSIDEVLEIGKKTAELTETCIARPIDIAITGDDETFTAFVESWLAPDRRDILVPDVTTGFWESFFEQSNKPNNPSRG